METDPNLAQVLADVAADPRSRLFRLRPEQWLATVRNESLRTSSQTVRLAPAERELLRVYRGEMGYLLRCKVIHALQSSKAAKTGLCYLDFDVPSVSEWKPRVDQLLGLSPPRAREFRGALESDRDPPEDLAIQRAVVAALAFEEHPSPYTCVTFALLLREEFGCARAYLRRIGSNAALGTEHYVLEQIGLVETLAGDVWAAIRTWESAAAEHPSAALHANLVIQGIVVCDRKLTAEYARRLMAHDDGRPVEAAIKNVRARGHRPGGWSVAVKQFARTMLDELPDSTKGIADAFVEG